MTSHAAVAFGAVLIACTHADPPAPATVPGPAAASTDAASVTAAARPPRSASAVSVPPNPPAVSTVAFDCGHSNMPWGTGSQQSSTVYDLEAGTVTVRTTQTPDAPRGDNPTDVAGAPRTTASTTQVPAAKLAQLRTAVAEVVAGGWYEPEYPVPEGTSCTLSLAGRGSPPFFAIAKANTANGDAVAALVKAL